MKSQSKGDWYLQILEDLKELGMDDLTFGDMKAIKKEKMKAMVKKACSELALQYLTSKKGSKMENLKYEEMKTSKYLLSEELTIAEK